MHVLPLGQHIAVVPEATKRHVFPLEQQKFEGVWPRQETGQESSSSSRESKVVALDLSYARRNSIELNFEETPAQVLPASKSKKRL